MQEKRLILALVISSAILFLWTYLSPVKTPPPNQSAPQSTASPSATQSPTQAANVQTSTPQTVAQSQSQAPQRTITIRTPLYDAKFDTRGAEPISWVIKKNNNSQKPIHSVAGGALELISPKGLEVQPRQVPLQLQTGDTAVDQVLASSTYQVDGVESAGDVDLNLGSGETKEITFSLDQNGIQVKKTLRFSADQYATELGITVKRGADVVPQVRLVIGPSIGDQGVEHHTFYSVAPEGIAFVGDRVERHPAAGINTNKNSPDTLTLNGPVDWAGVGDTYFAMVAVPGQRTQGLEYRTVAYEYKSKNGSAEKRYLTTALVPILSDGSSSVLYAGPKDHYILTAASAEVAALVKRPLDLEPMIDYGWLAWLSRPLAVPILKCITYLYHLTGSYGVAIILFTIGVYSLFFPLKWRSSKAMKKAQKMAPKMKELQEKIKGMKQNDPRLKELQMEQLRLMKEGNPLGGCLPLLIQMPFLFALYRAITISLDFRQAPFLWLGDLSSGDPKHILEFMMAGTMIVLQLITPAPSADPVQRKMMAIGMPVMMLYVLWGAPSGLLLYWLVGNIVGFSQQFVINRFTKSEDDEPPAQPSGTGGRKKPAAPVVSRA
jgi:YidC/Oxa1 family membrane protein insertase